MHERILVAFGNMMAMMTLTLRQLSPHPGEAQALQP